MKLASATAVLLLLTAPAFADSVKSDIDKANAKWLAAFNKGDGAAIAALYTENATALPAGAPIAKGRAEIQKFWQGVIDQGVKNVVLTTNSVESYGKAAREIGQFTFDAPDAQKNMTHVEGKYVVVWKKAKGGWQLDTDIWNMNK
jgi:uncharacterized protein (TIGR02246 family)